MNEKSAKIAGDACLDSTKLLNNCLFGIRDTSGHDEFVHYRTAVGQVLGTLYSDIMRPIFAEFPQLEPEPLKRRD